MAIKSSGSLSFRNDIVGEFPDTAPHSLTDFYEGGGIVPTTPANGPIANTGKINFKSFYNATNRITINVTLSSTTSGHNLYTNRGPTYVAGISDITYTIPSGTNVRAANTSVAAITVPSSFTSGDTVAVVNNGIVAGRGGNGGSGGNAPSTPETFSKGTAGSPGGDAVYAAFPISWSGSGTTEGGGGGGAGGRGGRDSYTIKGQSYDDVAGGGGGGGGAQGGVGGSGGSPGGRTGSNGPNTGTTGGAGGGSGDTSGLAFPYENISGGGAGGNLGQAGSSVGSGPSFTAGGNAGKRIDPASPAPVSGLYNSPS